MGATLDSIMQVKNYESQREQQAFQMAQALNQAKQQAAAQQLAQMQNAQNQQNTDKELQLKSLLTNAQVANLQSDVAKNNFSLLEQQKQNDVLNKIMSGDSGQFGGLDVKSVKIGDVTFDVPSKSSIASVDMTKLPKIENGDKSAFLSSLPPDVATNVQSAANYDLGTKDVYGIRSNSGDRAKFDALVKTINPNWDAKEYDRRQSFLKKWDSSPQYSQTQQSLDLVANHIVALNDSFNKLNNGNVMIANAGKNEVARQLGNKEVQTAIIDAQAVSTEFAKALRGAGVLNEKEEAAWEKRISTSASPDQIKSITSELVNLLAPRFSNQLNKYKSVMGKYPSGVFTKEAISAIKNFSTKDLPSSLNDYISQESGSVDNSSSSPKSKSTFRVIGVRSK